jgi:hypothetical protein
MTWAPLIKVVNQHEPNIGKRKGVRILNVHASWEKICQLMHMQVCNCGKRIFR